MPLVKTSFLQPRSLLAGETLVPLLGNGQLQTLALRQGDVGLVALADNEDISEPGGEGVTVGVLHVDYVEGARVTLPGHNGANTPGVTSSGDHAQVARVEGDGVLDLTGGNVQLDRVVDLDDGVGVADGAAIAGVQVGDTLGTGLHLVDFAELVLGLLGGDPVDGEPALHVVDDAEV